MLDAYPHIGVIGALPEEVDCLHEVLADEQITERVGRRFHDGRIGHQRITLVQSRIGKVAAAITATTLIRDCDVDAIIFTGVAGALADELAVGDVVIASELIQHDLQGPPEMFARGEIPMLGVTVMPTDDALTSEAVRAARTFLDDRFDTLVTPQTLVDLGIGRPRVHVGFPSVPRGLRPSLLRGDPHPNVRVTRCDRGRQGVTTTPRQKATRPWISAAASFGAG